MTELQFQALREAIYLECLRRLRLKVETNPTDLTPSEEMQALDAGFLDEPYPHTFD